jgi:hypothetical protein
MTSPDNDTQVTLDDFRACEWGKVIANIQNKECVTHFEAFRTEADDSKADGSERASLVFGLLRNICAFGFEPRQIGDPFPPMMTLGNQRTATPADIKIGGVDSNGARTKVSRVREKSRVGGDYIFEAALVLVQWPRIETVASRRPGRWEGVRHDEIIGGQGARSCVFSFFRGIPGKAQSRTRATRRQRRRY